MHGGGDAKFWSTSSLFLKTFHTFGLILYNIRERCRHVGREMLPIPLLSINVVMILSLYLDVDVVDVVVC